MPFNQNYFVDNIISKGKKVKIIMNSVNTKKSQVSVNMLLDSLLLEVRRKVRLNAYHGIHKISHNCFSMSGKATTFL